MDKHAAAAIGEPVIDGVILLARGSAKKYRGQVAPIGGVVGVVVARATKDTTPETPAPGGYTGGAFLALTSSRLVLFSTISGVFKQKLGEQLTEYRPGEIDRFEFGKAAAGIGTLDVVSVNGDRWAFEFSKVSHKKLVRMAEATKTLVVEA